IEDIEDYLGSFREDYRMTIEASIRATAADLIERGKQLPSPLQKWVVALLRTPLPPSSFVTYRGGIHTRDEIIGFAIEHICRATNLPAIANRERRTCSPSACSIVAEALIEGKTGVCIGEAAVEKIWEKHKKNADKDEFLK